MPYDFDKIIPRRQSDSHKWNEYDQSVLPLWVADMDFPAPPAVIQALHERIDHSIFGYARFDCDLYATMIERLERLYAWQVQEDEILLFPGVMNAVHLTALAVTQPGEAVMVQTPVYPYIYKTPHTTRRTRQVMQLTRAACGSYAIDFDAFEAAITPETRLFILCNPHNPVGRVFRRPELERMADICLRHNIIICSDEIHCDVLFAGHAHTPIASLSPEIAKNTLTMMSPSKSFNLAGLHCSFAIIQNPELRRQIRDARMGLTGGANLLGQLAARTAYQSGQEWLRELLIYLQGNRDYLFDAVKLGFPTLRMSPMEGTYLAWIDCRDSGISGNPYDFFLKEARIAFSDGASFGPGGEGFVRLNFACPRALLNQALDQMHAALARHGLA
ncbi:MAG TPA: PatB family C-S lyase [Levilinea sp.]|nr:PatB family C-S lyase [Levilinea sp.]